MTRTRALLLGLAIWVTVPTTLLIARIWLVLWLRRRQCRKRGHRWDVDHDGGWCCGRCGRWI